MVTRENLQKMSKWVGFISVFTIISGVLQILFGLFAFIIGAIPGVITLIMGLKLADAKKYAKEALYLDENGHQVDQILTSLNSYFKIQGILIIVGLSICLISLLFGGLSLL